MREATSEQIIENGFSSEKATALQSQLRKCVFPCVCERETQTQIQTDCKQKCPLCWNLPDGTRQNRTRDIAPPKPHQTPTPTRHTIYSAYSGPIQRKKERKQHAVSGMKEWMHLIYVFLKWKKCNHPTIDHIFVKPSKVRKRTHDVHQQDNAKISVSSQLIIKLLSQGVLQTKNKYAVVALMTSNS